MIESENGLEVLDDVRKRLDAVSMKKQTREPGAGGNLGASLLGSECDRAIWYKFRWSTPRGGPSSGTNARAMAIGDRTEADVVEDLRAAGYELHSENPKSTSEVSNQWRYEALGGVVSGYADGLINLDGAWASLEVKSANQAKANRFKKTGFADQPTWYAQIQLGLGLLDDHIKKKHYPAGPLAGALLVVENRNTLEWTPYFVPKYTPYFVRLLERAERIARATRPPTRVSNSPTRIPCRWCDYLDICHGSNSKSINCRSCTASKLLLPGDKFNKRATWLCETHGRGIDDFEPCSNYQEIPEVP